MTKDGTEARGKLLEDATGENLSTRAMVEYFEPLTSRLQDSIADGRLVGSDAEAGLLSFARRPEERGCVVLDHPQRVE